MRTKKKLHLLSKAASRVTSGVAFIGGPEDNFQLIIRCPIHVWSAIYNKLIKYDCDFRLSYYTGSIEIEDLALPQFRGIFHYIDVSGKLRKYQAAYVYPLNSQYAVSSDEHRRLVYLSLFLTAENFQYYDKQNRTFRQLSNTFEASLDFDKINSHGAL